MVRSAHHGSAPAAADGARGGTGRRSPLRVGRHGCVAARRGQGGFGCGERRVQRQGLGRGDACGGDRAMVGEGVLVVVIIASDGGPLRRGTQGDPCIVENTEKHMPA